MDGIDQGGGAGRRPTDTEILESMPRGSRSRDALLGLFVLIGVVSFVIVLYWMTDPATFRQRYMLVTSVEHAGGIRVSDPVQMNGVNVGRVNSFEMATGRVFITMEIEGEWDVPVGSQARLGAAGLFGGRTLEIAPTSAEAVYEPWDTLPSLPTASEDLLGTAGEVGAEAQAVLEQIRHVLDAETIGSVQGSARELEQLLTELSAFTRTQSAQLQELVASLNNTAEGIEAAEVGRTVASADSAIAALRNTGATLDATLVTLRSVLDRIDRGEGTLGRLAHDEALYENLNSAAVSLRALMEDIQANPSRYINLSLF